MTRRDLATIVGLSALWFAGAVWVSGCAGVLYPTPKTATLTVSESPDHAYAKALMAMGKLGGEITMQSDTHWQLSARVKNTVIMNVLVIPAGAGAQIVVTGSVVPNKLVVGTFDEVDQYLALLR